MPGAELSFEILSGALETVHGTAVTPPTHIFNLVGDVTPVLNFSRRTQSDGTLAEFRRSALTRKTGTWQASGDLDVNTICFFLECAVKGGASIGTPGGGTLSRTHTYSPTMTSDDLKSATIYWGDPNVQIFQGTYGMVDNITISNDASSTDGATMSVKGTCQGVLEVVAPTQPAFTTSSLIVGQGMQVWMDTTTIGTTAITGRVISAEHSLDTGLTYKYFATGTGSALTYTRHGRKKRHLETKITMELTDVAQYDLFAAGTVQKLRVRHNGQTAIEGALFPYVQVDTYGPLSDLAWSDLEGSNRAVSFTIQSEYDAGIAADFRIVVENAIATV